ncbi:alpha/beta hydrolase [Streptomyces sp. 549]|uniref:alpha/beta hydrolase n=1 Tax=Streptomyces sp. 549 TaxID=3049076 RepID=UPI0024C21A6F|nr:alpha/beta hydrolase [Streptomyces sp. 549]MDK1476293.1 alpha/beta hydrolase [Streptomyces sp. 549]
MSAARRGSTALAAAVCLLLAGCGGGSAGPLPAQPVNRAADGTTGTGDLPAELREQRLAWEECPAPTAAQGGGQAPAPLPDGTRWQCATLRAPLDYAEPDGETLGLALIRARTSAEADRRIGSLVFNFGGPGGSGVSTLPVSATDYEELRGRYDLVSFDPRGVGRSAGVRCLDDRELDAFHQEAVMPGSTAQGEELLAQQQRYADACKRRSGAVLPHLTTTNTARDLDLMREVLRDEKLHYFGISYGTELGGVYAHLFPEKVGRAVFDAVVDPRLTLAQSGLGQARGFQRALTNYLKACAEGENCPVGGSPEEGQKRITALLDGLDEQPLETADPDGRTLNSSLAASGIALSLYSEDFWGVLSEGLEDALDNNDGTLLLRLSDLLNGRQDNGRYDNSQAALTAISCADAKPRYTLDDIRERLPAFRAASPVFGEMSAWGLAMCHGWPVEGESDHPEVGAEGAAPIVVIGNTGDPATPYEGAAAMARGLGSGVAVQLTYEGEGHGAYNSGDACVQRAVNVYLLDGDVPKDGTTCTP